MNIIIEFIINFIDNFYYFKRINFFIKELEITNIVDVGSHKGEFFKSIIKKSPKIKSAVLVEPQDEILKNLYHLKSNFPYIKINIENLALGSKTEKKIIYINSLSSTSTLSVINVNSNWYKFKKMILFKIKKKFKKKKIVLTDTLDNLLKRNKIDKLDFLKIDTEGYEHQVLKGAHESLKNKKIKYIMVEKQLSKMYVNYDFKKVEKYLEKNGFINIKNFRFPLALFEDRIYKLKK